jgi:hypothetical protein
MLVAVRSIHRESSLVGISWRETGTIIPRWRIRRLRHHHRQLERQPIFGYFSHDLKLSLIFEASLYEVSP